METELTVQSWMDAVESIYGENSPWFEIIYEEWDSYFEQYRQSSGLEKDEADVVRYISYPWKRQQFRVIEVRQVFPNRKGFRKFQELRLDHPERTRIAALAGRTEEWNAFLQKYNAKRK